MKIPFFLGRIHHAIKLLPLAVALNNRNHEVSFIIADNSINIDPTTEYLHKYGINKFYHTKDFLSGSDISAAEGEILDILLTGKYEFLPWNSPHWMVSSLREAVYDLHGFRNFLSTHKPNVVFALHENNFWAKMFFYLAQQQGVKTCSLMEGIILEREEEDMGKYSMGTDYTNVLFAWSHYDKQFYADEHNIVPVGPAHLDEWINYKNQEPHQTNNIKIQVKQTLGLPLDKNVVLFAPPRLDLYHGDPMQAISRLYQYCGFNNLQLVIKLHPFQGDINFEMIAPNIPVFNDADAAPFIFASDVIVTQTSTIGLEALMLGKQVIELDLDYHGIDQPLWKEGAATLIEKDLTKIKKVLKEPLDITDFLNKRLPLADGKSVDRIASNLEGTQWIK